MRSLFFLLTGLLLSCAANARVLPIGSGGYSGLEAAAADARPGDTILFLAGTHQGGAYVENLQGRADAWITITGEAGALISGGGNAFQLTDPAWLRITRLAFDAQTGNGVNIDDGGSYATPAHHLLIEECEWLGIDATGNNDMLKLSGVDSFTVRGCRFINGAAGGSMIDMVGCHAGMFEANRFENAGSNCIQAKGGTRFIRIERNAFYNGGQRAINIGGSTGLPYFRPLDASFEASDILVAANIFTGSEAPIAYVGAVNCAVVQNTIYLPEKWAVRILQESTDARFQSCGNNTFLNNLVVIDNRAAGPTFNIGSNTAPETFQFRNNLWFNTESAAWGGPNTPTTDIESVIGRDPRLRAPALVDGDFSLLAGSPAIGSGTPMAAPLKDFLGNAFHIPPSIGAIEGNPPTSGAEFPPLASAMQVTVYPQPASGPITVRLRGVSATQAVLTLFDTFGRGVGRWEHVFIAPEATISLGLGSQSPGLYFLMVSAGAQHRLLPLVLQR
ncbi:MAG: right-handed parallel beta-helix repeat-containing protein [Bacteroidetes bacterium]|nr:right-handed parallel beta-helix repeat-containing protein [Bacteroidota bacterium]